MGKHSKKTEKLKIKAIYDDFLANVNLSEEQIKIYLNDDYTLKKIDIYKNDYNVEANKYVCDTDAVAESEKYDCNKEWWNFG